MIPIHFNYPATRLDTDHQPTEPQSGTHYIVARNGTFLRKKMPWVDAIIPVSEIKVLDPVFPSAKLLLPPLPAEILAKCLKLAKHICDISQSEVILLLHYQEESGYALSIPAQEVTPGRIDYDATSSESNSTFVGTIHSHGTLDAYHSEIDYQDEKHTDGIHITLGNVDLYPSFSLSGEMAINGNRFPIEQTWFQGLIMVRQPIIDLGMNCPNQAEYRIDFPAIETWTIPEEWLLAINHAELKKPWGKKRRKV